MEVIITEMSLDEYISSCPRLDAQTNLILNETEESIFHLKLKFDLDITEYKEDEWDI